MSNTISNVTKEFEPVVRDIEAALDDCRVRRRKEIVQKLKAAREIGDLSDNATYDAAITERSINEQRISHLSALLTTFSDIPDSENIDSEKEYSVLKKQFINSNGTLLEEDQLGENLNSIKCIDEYKVYTPDGKILTLTEKCENWSTQITYTYDETGRCISHKDITSEDDQNTKAIYAEYIYSEDGSLSAIKYYENEVLTSEKRYEYDGDQETAFIYKHGVLNAITITSHHGNNTLSCTLDPNYNLVRYKVISDSLKQVILSYDQGNYQYLDSLTLDDDGRMTGSSYIILFKNGRKERLTCKTRYETIVRD